MILWGTKNCIVAQPPCCNICACMYSLMIPNETQTQIALPDIYMYGIPKARLTPRTVLRAVGVETASVALLSGLCYPSAFESAVAQQSCVFKWPTGERMNERR